MIGMLAWRTLSDRPRRTAMLLLGLGIAVGVMITLLSIGEAVLVQATDKDLVGGGDVLLLPAGIDVEVMKIGGPTGMYSMLANARFLFRQVLSGPRFAATFVPVTPDGAELPFAAASPGLVEKVMYARLARPESATKDPREVLAHGFIPSLDVAAGGPTASFASQGIAWRDHDADRMWVDPPIDSLYNDMDRFHLPPRSLPDLERWAEWLYFNFTDPATGVFGYVSFIASGDIQAGGGRATPLLQIVRPGQPALLLRTEMPLAADDISLTRVALRFGTDTTATFRDGAWRLHLGWDDAKGPVSVDLTVRPLLDLYYPPVLLQDSERWISGYTVPALRTEVSGTIRCPGVALTLRDAPGYHDHNWGTWRGVSWEWGTASSAEHALLYGRVEQPTHSPGTSGAGIFLLLAQARSAGQRGGALALFRPQSTHYDWGEPPARGAARAPTAMTLAATSESGTTSLDPAARDGIEVRLDVHTVTSSRMREPEEQVFLQLQGSYDVRARIAGREIRFATPGFAEVFVPPAFPSAP
ncbi:MAG TPA: hypothetical protein VFD07_10395 [Candidatus Krumholzibacteria bacterium]|nr:hypothetical protein [Candidatus Krumholzibacteria bacterium]